MKKLGRFMEKKENMTKNKKLIYLIMCLIIAICILIAIVFLFKEISDKKESGNEISRITNHEDYTWEEFDALTAAQQEAFRDTFNNDEDFEKWLKKAKGTVKESEGSNPWKKGDKQPKDYTWEEFDALTAAQQEAFRDTFNNDEDFEKWLKKAKGIVKESEGSNPWKKGDKQPKDYTWEEFNALTAAQQEAFRDTFNNDEDFEEWLLRVKD